MRLIQGWAAKVQETEVTTVTNKKVPWPVLSWVDLTSARERGNDGSTDKAAEFTYTFPDRSTWWWRINIDYSCLELQAKPTTFNQASGVEGRTTEMIQAILDTHIFELALRKMSLRTDPLVGGGHLTIDRSTTFGNNARWIRNFLVLYANDAATWRGGRRRLQRTGVHRAHRRWASRLRPRDPGLRPSGHRPEPDGGRRPRQGLARPGLPQGALPGGRPPTIRG